MLPLVSIDFPRFDSYAAAEAAAYIRRLAIPHGSLGRLHDLAVKIAGITALPRPVVSRCAAVVFCADHGVARRGVSGFDQSVTRENTRLIATGRATINAFTRAVGARLIAMDVGIVEPLDPAWRNTSVRYEERRIRPGTHDLAEQAAMSAAEAEAAMRVGADLVTDLAHDSDVFVFGEMGIGNTTASCALSCAMLGANVDEIMSRGSGASAAALHRKRDAVNVALDRWRLLNEQSAFSALWNMGGFEIAAIAGAVIEAARHRKPVLVDGVVATTAVAVAASIAPEAAYVLIGASRSADRGQKLLLELLRLNPILDLGMRLGEGTAAVLAWPIVRAAVAQFHELQTIDVLLSSNGGR